MLAATPVLVSPKLTFLLASTLAVVPVPFWKFTVLPAAIFWLPEAFAEMLKLVVGVCWCATCKRCTIPSEILASSTCRRIDAKCCAGEAQAITVCVRGVSIDVSATHKRRTVPLKFRRAATSWAIDRKHRSCQRNIVTACVCRICITYDHTATICEAERASTTVPAESLIVSVIE